MADKYMYPEEYKILRNQQIEATQLSSKSKSTSKSSLSASADESPQLEQYTTKVLLHDCLYPLRHRSL